MQIKTRYCLLLFFPAVATGSYAQQLPDAGSVQRDAVPRMLQPPKESPEIRIDAAPAGADEDTAAGGPQVQVNRIEFSGNTLLSSAVLREAVTDLLGQLLDLAGLRAITQRLSDRYAAAGYAFTKAYLPPQEIIDGSLKVMLIEGRYGKVSIEGDARLASASQDFLRGLDPGNPIESALLERRLLVLSDQPGVKISPLLRAGEADGTGDLVVTVTRSSLTNIDVGYDNHGSVSTGEHRVRVNAGLDSPFRLGDQLQLRAVSSEADLWLGNVVYGFPVGVTGLRASVGFSRTAYELGGDFRSLDASGTADSTSAGLTYSLRRTPTSNALVSLTFEKKTLRDQIGLIESDERKSSRNLNLSVQFDRQDSRGITYGSIGVVPGTLRLDGESALLDAVSGRRAAGGFVKWTLDVARIQTVSNTGITVFARFAAQLADQNLDSSEKFSLGGPYAVRAYPVGEGSGDEGVLAQIELRAATGTLMPFVFVDAARSTLNANRASLLVPPLENSRSLVGAGIGARLNRGKLTADGVVGGRVYGGAPRAENEDSSFRVWATLTYRL